MHVMGISHINVNIGQCGGRYAKAIMENNLSYHFTSNISAYHKTSLISYAYSLYYFVTECF